MRIWGERLTRLLPPGLRFHGCEYFFSENEPVVCRPEEALDRLLRAKMDSLVLENFWIERNSRKG